MEMEKGSLHQTMDTHNICSAGIKDKCERIRNVFMAAEKGREKSIKY